MAPERRSRPPSAMASAHLISAICLGRSAGRGLLTALGNWRVPTLSEEPAPFIWPAPSPSNSLISLWPYGITGSEEACSQPAYATLPLDEVVVSHLWAAPGALVAIGEVANQ
jgi:hypothetical protein